jgi:hypothetical protein
MERRVQRDMARRSLAETRSMHPPERCKIGLDMAKLLSTGSADMI